MDGADVSGRRKIDLAEYERRLEEQRIATRKRRSCNCVPPTEDEKRRYGASMVKWHPHGTLPTCPPKPPVQEHCSPSLAMTGRCHCPRHRDEYTDACP